MQLDESTHPPEQTEQDVPTPGLLADGWQHAARLVGGEARLLGGCLLLAVLIGTYWIWPKTVPSAEAIYGEFERYREEYTDLKSELIVDEAVWREKTASARARVKAIVQGLKDRRTGASATKPEKQELLWAAEDGLVKLLASCQIASHFK